MVGQKTTFTNWLEANGFTVKGVRQKDDASATFFNACDLGFGRSMHMKIGPKQKDGTNNLAFYVSNFPTTAAANSGIGLIATVAMEYIYNAKINKHIITFYVFGNNTIIVGARPQARTFLVGNRLTSADLDGNGQKFVPNLCMVCHGGAFSSMQAATNRTDTTGDLGARFVPFDPASYNYQNLKGTNSFGELAASFLALNKGVLSGNPTSTTTNLIFGWYGGKALTGAFNPNYVPTGWKNAGGNNNIQPAYSGAFAVSCRSCHVVRVNDNKAFPAFEDLGKNDVTRLVYAIPAEKCMPNALRTFTIFWGSQSANTKAVKQLNPPPPADQTLLLSTALNIKGDRPLPAKAK